MRKTFAGAMALAAAALVGCSTTYDPEKGTIPYHIRVEASEPGVRIETNSVYAGETPLRLMVLGDKEGAFHNVGNPEYVVHAIPLHTNQSSQTQIFSTGTKSSPGVRIPGLIFFDMTRKTGSFFIDVTPEN